MPATIARQPPYGAPPKQDGRVRPALPRVSLIIPVLNDAAGLKRCLSSILANDYSPDRVEVIVADNGSNDGSPEVAVAYGAKVLRLPGLSVAEVRNRAARTASGEVLAFVDADHELSGAWLTAAIRALREPGVGAAGAPYHPPSDATWVQRLYDSLRSHGIEPKETRWLGSGNLAVWKDAFLGVGGFDPALTACEDVDFCRRLAEAGWRLVADGRLHSIHYGDPRTLRQLFRSELWRGRDNLRVSLRGRVALRDLPSLVTPLLILASVATLPISVGLASLGAPLPLAGILTLALAVPGARSVVMVRRLASRAPVSMVQALIVATTYDLARALALVARRPHRRAV